MNNPFKHSSMQIEYAYILVLKRMDMSLLVSLYDNHMEN